jgi:hypothetical protein
VAATNDHINLQLHLHRPSPLAVGPLPRGVPEGTGRLRSVTATLAVKRKR